MIVEYFRLLWPCIMNVGWRERNQQYAINLMFIIKLLSQHVSGIIMPIIRRTRVCTAAYGVLHWLWLLSLLTPYEHFFIQSFHKNFNSSRPSSTQPQPSQPVQNTICGSAHFVPLMMGIMMPETCWDISLVINIRLVASCWFLSLHPTFMMHGHKSLKYYFKIEFSVVEYGGFQSSTVIGSNKLDTLNSEHVVQLIIRILQMKFSGTVLWEGVESARNSPHCGRDRSPTVARVGFLLPHRPKGLFLWPLLLCQEES